MKKMLKLFTLVLIIIGITCTLSACSNDTLPDGRYEPVDERVKFSTPYIIIDGDDFTSGMVGGLMAETVKYTYNEGTITFVDSGVGVSLACEYKEGSLWLAGVEYKKVD